MFALELLTHFSLRCSSQDEFSWRLDLADIIRDKAGQSLSPADTAWHTQEWYLQGLTPFEAFDKWVELHYLVPLLKMGQLPPAKASGLVSGTTPCT